MPWLRLASHDLHPVAIPIYQVRGIFLFHACGRNLPDRSIRGSKAPHQASNRSRGKGEVKTEDCTEYVALPPRKGQFHRTDRVESGRESSPVDPISLVYRNLKKLRGIWNLGSTGKGRLGEGGRGRGMRNEILGSRRVDR